MDFRKVAKAFATKHDLEHVSSFNIVNSVMFNTDDIDNDIDDKWSDVVARMLKVYGVDRYVFEMWSEVVERGCGKCDTAVYKEWGVNCAYCVTVAGGCDRCPLKSCRRGSAYSAWIHDDLNGAIVIRDIAKERLDANKS